MGISAIKLISINIFSSVSKKKRQEKKRKKSSSIHTFSGLSEPQLLISFLYSSQCSSANLHNVFNCVSSAELASDNFVHVSCDFSGLDFCHFLTAPTIDGVDDPPVPGSPSNCKSTNHLRDKTHKSCISF